MFPILSWVRAVASITISLRPSWSRITQVEAAGDKSRAEGLILENPAESECFVLDSPAPGLIWAEMETEIGLVGEYSPASQC